MGELQIGRHHLARGAAIDVVRNDHIGLGTDEALTDRAKVGAVGLPHFNFPPTIAIQKQSTQIVRKSSAQVRTVRDDEVSTTA